MILSQQNMFFGLNFPGKETDLDKVAKDMSTPVLVFPGILWQEIRYITHKIPNSEYALFLTLERLDPKRPHFIATKLHMPKQTASSAGVRLDTKDCERLWGELNTPHRHICHLHSHASMNVFWSGVDNEQQLTPNDLGFLDDFRFYVVVNAKDELLCSYVNYKPVLFRVDAAVALSFSEPEHCGFLTTARKKELEAMIDAQITKPVETAAPVKGFTGYNTTDKYDWYGYDYGYYGYGSNRAKLTADNKFADLSLPIVRETSPTLKRIISDKNALKEFIYEAECLQDDPLAQNAFAWFVQILLNNGISEQVIRYDASTLGVFVSELFGAINGLPLEEFEYLSSDAMLKLGKRPDRAKAIEEIVVDEIVPIYESFMEDAVLAAELMQKA